MKIGKQRNSMLTRNNNKKSEIRRKLNNVIFNKNTLKGILMKFAPKRLALSLFVAAFGLILNALAPAAPDKLPDLPKYYDWKLGDVNYDNSVIGGDVTYGVRFFKGIGAVPPESVYIDTTCDFVDNGYYLYYTADVNGNCEFRGSDITRLVAYFKGTATMSSCPYTKKRGIKNVFDADINAGDTIYWVSETTYVLNNFVFVESTAVLNIERGTIIKGLPGQAADAKALIICKGAKIYANGDECNPIIMTASIDNVGDLDDMPDDASGAGKYGSILILGRSSNNAPGGLGQIEGIPSTELRGQWGGGTTPDENDNSGELSYWSIRHGGSIIGANNEINGLTMAALGRGTTIHHVEVFNNLDDGFEFFGGTIEPKYLVSFFNDDDNFDYDEGYTGKGQFWFTIQHPLHGNRSGEHDGGTNPITAEPYSEPLIANVTYFGSGLSQTVTNNSDDFAIIDRDNAGGHYFSGIFCEWQKYGYDVEDRWPSDCPEMWDASHLSMDHTFWWNIGVTNNPDFNTVLRTFPDQSFGITPTPWAFTADTMMAPLTRPFAAAPQIGTVHDTHLEDPQINGISRTADGTLDPRPNPASPAATSAFDPHTANSWFTSTNYYGAFDPNAPLWTRGWTWMWKKGYTPR
jgi:hypothetical protein